MKNIAIITLAVALENEKGYSRFRFLANLLSEQYHVDLITSSFQHWEKKQRDKAVVSSMKNPYNILLAYEPGYKTNVDLRRVISHHIAVKNIITLLEKKEYDLIYCIIPDNEMAAKVGEYAHTHSIKYIVDVEDVWPEGMEMVSPFPKFMNDIIFKPYRVNAEKAYLYADAFVGTSDEYRDIPKTKYGITDKPAITAYVGCDLNDFDEGVDEFADKIEKKENEFWVTYAGNLGSSYDIGTLIKAAQILYQMGKRDVKFKILGGGPLENEFKQLAEKKENFIQFLGYTPYRKMASYLSKSDILINSFVCKAPQSIVTKIGDYLAAGKPMINTLSSPEFRMKVKNDNFGRNVIAEDEQKLADLILEMKNKPDMLKRMGENARKICEEEFDRKNSYRKILELISTLVGEIE